MNWGAFALGAAAGGLLVLAIAKPNEATCCTRVANAGRDKIAGYAGPFSGLVSGFLDWTGLTPQIPGLLDTFGVPA